MGNGITRETWDKAKPDTKLDILFDLCMEIKGSKIQNGLIHFAGSMLGGAFIIMAYVRFFAPAVKAAGGP